MDGRECGVDEKNEQYTTPIPPGIEAALIHARAACFAASTATIANAATDATDSDSLSALGREIQDLRSLETSGEAVLLKSELLKPSIDLINGTTRALRQEGKQVDYGQIRRSICTAKQRIAEIITFSKHSGRYLLLLRLSYIHTLRAAEILGIRIPEERRLFLSNVRKSGVPKPDISVVPMATLRGVCDLYILCNNLAHTLNEYYDPEKTKVFSMVLTGIRCLVFKRGYLGAATRFIKTYREYDSKINKNSAKAERHLREKDKGKLQQATEVTFKLCKHQSSHNLFKSYPPETIEQTLLSTEILKNITREEVAKLSTQITHSTEDIYTLLGALIPDKMSPAVREMFKDLAGEFKKFLLDLPLLYVSEKYLREACPDPHKHICAALGLVSEVMKHTSAGGSDDSISYPNDLLGLLTRIESGNTSSQATPLDYLIGNLWNTLQQCLERTSNIERAAKVISERISLLEDIFKTPSYSSFMRLAAQYLSHAECLLANRDANAIQRHLLIPTLQVEEFLLEIGSILREDEFLNLKQRLKQLSCPSTSESNSDPEKLKQPLIAALDELGSLKLTELNSRSEVLVVSEVLERNIAVLNEFCSVAASPLSQFVGFSLERAYLQYLTHKFRGLLRKAYNLAICFPEYDLQKKMLRPPKVKGDDAAPGPKGDDATPEPKGADATPEPKGAAATPGPKGADATPGPKGADDVPEPEDDDDVPAPEDDDVVLEPKSATVPKREREAGKPMHEILQTRKTKSKFALKAKILELMHQATVHLTESVHSALPILNAELPEFSSNLLDAVTKSLSKYTDPGLKSAIEYKFYCYILIHALCSPVRIPKIKIPDSYEELLLSANKSHALLTKAAHILELESKLKVFPYPSGINNIPYMSSPGISDILERIYVYSGWEKFTSMLRAFECFSYKSVKLAPSETLLLRILDNQDFDALHLYIKHCEVTSARHLHSVLNIFTLFLAKYEQNAGTDFVRRLREILMDLLPKDVTQQYFDLLGYDISMITAYSTQFDSELCYSIADLCCNYKLSKEVFYEIAPHQQVMYEYLNAGKGIVSPCRLLSLKNVWNYCKEFFTKLWHSICKFVQLCRTTLVGFYSPCCAAQSQEEVQPQEDAGQSTSREFIPVIEVDQPIRKKEDISSPKISESLNAAQIEPIKKPEKVTPCSR